MTKETDDDETETAEHIKLDDLSTKRFERELANPSPPTPALVELFTEPEAEPEEYVEQCADCGAPQPHFCQGVPGGFSDDEET